MSKNKLIYPFIFIISFSVLILFAFDLEINYGSRYSTQVLSNLIDTDYVQPERGRFLDSNGVLLAVNQTYFEFHINSESYNKQSIDKLSNLLEENRDNKLSKEILNSLKKMNLKSNKTLLLTSYDSKYIAKQQEFLNKISSYINVKKKYKRVYKFPYLFAHVIGYTGIPTEEDLNEYYSLDSTIGKYKLEHQLEGVLRGVKEKKYKIEGVEVVQDGIRGSDVYLTIDSKWQESLYTILKKYSDKNSAISAAGVIVEVDSGNVKALVSYPTFDPNDFINGISAEKYNSLLENSHTPLVDKAINLTAAPGSTFKLISAYNLLVNNIVNESSTYFSNRCISLGVDANFCEFGQLFYGQMNIVRAIYMSSNLFFCHYTLQQQEQNDIYKLIESAKLFGLSKKTGINLEGESSGSLPETKRENWYAGDTCNTAIGQGEVLATPLQMALVPLIIERNGETVRPNLISKIVNSKGEIVQEPKAGFKKMFDLKENIKEIIQEGMHGVIRNPESALYPLFTSIPNEIKAKTGTAETVFIDKGNIVETVHGWIIGIFEAKGKKYSFAFHLNHGGGGYNTSFVLKDFIECLNSNYESSTCNE